MDPEARVVITGKDATAAAFNSADKSLKQFQRTAMGMKSLLQSFGVIFSARAFAGWIKGALDAKDMTDAQLESTKRARDALDSMRESSDELAQSLAISLTPALEGVAHFMTGLSAAFLNGDPVIYGKQIQDLKDDIEDLYKHGIDTGIGTIILRPEDVEKEKQLLAQIEDLKKKQFDALTGGPTGRDRSQGITEQEIQAINDLIAQINTPKAREPFITQEELINLESFLHELQQRPPLITQEELVDLETFIHDLNQVPERLTQEEWIDLESFIYDLNHMESEASEVAKSIGQDFRSAFAGWLGGAELDFGSFLKRLAAEMFTSTLFKGLGSLFAGSTGGAAKFLGDFFGGSRDSGGRGEAGKAYLIGKGAQPEMFVPDTAGSFYPAGAMAGGGTVIHQTFQMAMPPEWRAQAAMAGRAAASEMIATVEKLRRGER